VAPSRQGHQSRLHQALRPRLNGKVERSHRIDAEEFYRLLNGVVIDDAEVFNEKLQEWEHSTTTHVLTVLWAVRRPPYETAYKDDPGCQPSASVTH
jgi:hypothetical protein